jgi:hypothetical protein
VPNPPRQPVVKIRFDRKRNLWEASATGPFAIAVLAIVVIATLAFAFCLNR